MLVWSGSASAKSVDIVGIQNELVIEMDVLEDILLLIIVMMLGCWILAWEVPLIPHAVSSTCETFNRHFDDATMTNQQPEGR